MSQILSYTSYDHLNLQMIPVIASFNCEGKIKPLYVGINGEQFKVESYWIRSCFTNQMEFHCKLIVNDKLCPIIITYYIKECLWTIPASGIQRLPN